MEKRHYINKKALHAGHVRYNYYFCFLFVIFFFIFAWKMDFWKIWHDIHFFYVFYHFFLSCKQKSAT